MLNAFKVPHRFDQCMHSVVKCYFEFELRTAIFFLWNFSVDKYVNRHIIIRNKHETVHNYVISIIISNAYQLL